MNLIFLNQIRIIDSILEAGMIPFIELGFKGKVIHKSLEDIVIKEEFLFKSRKIENVLNKYEKFLKHCISKYGSKPGLQLEI